MSRNVRTIVVATILTVPLFILKQYVHALEVLFWILMWRHYFLEPLDETNTAQTLPSREEFFKDVSESGFDAKQQLQGDDEEKLAQLADQEKKPVIDATAPDDPNGPYCSACLSKTGIVLCCQHIFCKTCLIKQRGQGVCPTCQTPLWRRNRLPTGKKDRWCYKAILISSLIILGMFMVKFHLCWSVLPSKSADVCSRALCTLDFSDRLFGRISTPLMLSLAIMRTWSEWSMDDGMPHRWDLWSPGNDVSPLIASQLFSHALRVSDDLEKVFDVMMRGS